MIIVTSLSGSPAEHFKNYSKLCDYLMELENEKLTAESQDFQRMSWSFTIHPLRRVVAFYAHLKDTHEAIQEAYSIIH